MSNQCSGKLVNVDASFLPPLIEDASNIIRKTFAAITAMKSRERMEGISVQDRV
jgi:hypothetical protein